MSSFNQSEIHQHAQEVNGEQENIDTDSYNSNDINIEETSDQPEPEVLQNVSNENKKKTKSCKSTLFWRVVPFLSIVVAFVAICSNHYKSKSTR